MNTSRLPSKKTSQKLDQETLTVLIPKLKKILEKEERAQERLNEKYPLLREPSYSY